MEELIISYRNSRRVLRALRTLSTNEAERESYSESIADINYCIEWIRTGRRPGGIRGVERPYRLKIWKPEWLERYDSSRSAFSIVRDVSIRELPEDERRQIMEVMIDLTDRERECFILHHVDGMSMQEVGDELNIGKSTVQIHIDRAREKIEKKKRMAQVLLF